MECEVFCPLEEMMFPGAPCSVMPSNSIVTLHWTRSQFFINWETNVTNLDLLIMKSLTKTLKAPIQTSTKASAWPDPSFSSPQKDNYVKKLESNSGPLSHIVPPPPPHPQLTHTLIRRLGLGPKRDSELPRAAGNHSHNPTCSKSQVSKRRQREDWFAPLPLATQTTASES